ncbi:MAG: site-2 protease family protein [Alphaproteobacteria bacterium]|nr:site-2 protease family protein [Alphaproteobacteria bacterium]
MLPVMIAITFHEAAHGYVAWRHGDDTAKRLGRVTFNPLKHIVPFGTVLLPALLLLGSGGRFVFGFAKPVPVDFSRLRQPRRDMVRVALAGPAVNIVLAVLCAVLFRFAAWLPDFLSDWVALNLANAVLINLVLAVFNMLPIPPLDGGRVAVGLLPRSLALPLARLERWGLFIILAMLFLLPWLGRSIGVDLDLFAWLVGGPVEFLLRLIGALTGNL